MSTPVRTSALVELRRTSPLGIVAVTYRDGRRDVSLRLPDGAIVERPDPDTRCEAPARPPTVVVLGPDGRAATVHHVQLGLISGHAELAGVFLLPIGEVAAVYGALAVPLG